MARYKPYNFKHEIEWYYPANSAAHFSTKEIRALYSEYAKVARKRIARLQNSQFYDTEAAQERFDPLPKDLTNSQVRKSLYEVVLFLRRQSSSVSGLTQQLKNFVASMNERGYDWVNMGNAKAFADFMDKVKDHYSNRKEWYPEGTVELYEEAVINRGVDPEELLENFEFYMEDYQRLPNRIQQKKDDKQREKESKRAFQKRKERVNRYEEDRRRRRQRPGKRKLRPLGSHRRR